MARRIYLQLTYDEYKDLERQLKSWAERETTHTSVPGPFYHKSISFTIGEIQFEFHGPAVAGEEAKPESHGPAVAGEEAKPESHGPAVAGEEAKPESRQGLHPLRICPGCGYHHGVFVTLSCGHRVCSYCNKYCAHKCEGVRP